jgi:hypothetical protein
MVHTPPTPPAPAPLTPAFGQNASTGKINIFDTAKYEIVQVDGFGSTAKLNAFKKAYEKTSGKFGSMDEFIVALTEQPDEKLLGMKNRFADYGETIDAVLKLKEVYAELSRYFPPDELESREGFVSILLKNNDKALQKEFGGFKERIVYVRDKADGSILGGSNFASYLGKNAKELNAATAHDIYSFVRTESRGQGIATQIAQIRFSETEKLAKAKAGLNAPLVVIMSEQNSPLKMNLHEYLTDITMAMDPCDRLKAWGKVGYQAMAFSYVQPSLGEGLEAVRMLDLHVQPREKDKAELTTNGIDGRIVDNHLHMFMNLSVLDDGVTYATDPDCQNMTAELSAKPKTALYKMDPVALQKDIYAVLKLAQAGVLPSPETDAAFYEKPFGAIIVDPAYSAVIKATSAAITEAEIRSIHDGIKAKFLSEPEVDALLTASAGPTSSKT